MGFRKLTGVAVSVGALALAGCSDVEETASGSNVQSATTEANESEFAKVGDTVPVDCVGSECLGEFEVEEILLDEACKVTLAAEEIPEGMQLVQVSGVLTATEKLTDDQGAEIGVSPDIVEAWDPENFKTTGDWGGGCDIPQGYEQWATVRAKTGEKVRMYGSFLIPKDAVALGVGNSKFDLTKLEKPSGQNPTKSPTVEQGEDGDRTGADDQRAVDPVPPAQPEEDPVIGYTEAPGLEEPHRMDKQIAYCGDPGIHETGTTFFTDGTSGWTQNCAAQMM